MTEQITTTGLLEASPGWVQLIEDLETAVLKLSVKTHSSSLVDNGWFMFRTTQDGETAESANQLFCMARLAVVAEAIAIAATMGPIAFDHDDPDRAALLRDMWSSGCWIASPHQIRERHLTTPHNPPASAPLPANVASHPAAAMLAIRIRSQPDCCRSGDAWAIEAWRALEDKCEK